MRPPNDIFRWKCQAILEGLVEGATLEESKQALWEYVFDNCTSWNEPYDPELCTRALAFEAAQRQSAAGGGK